MHFAAYILFVLMLDFFIQQNETVLLDEHIEQAQSLKLTEIV